MSAAYFNLWAFLWLLLNVNKTNGVDYASLVFVPEYKLLEQEIQNVYQHKKDEYNRESRNISGWLWTNATND